MNCNLFDRPRRAPERHVRTHIDTTHYGMYRPPPVGEKRGGGGETGNNDTFSAVITISHPPFICVRCCIVWQLRFRCGGATYEVDNPSLWDARSCWLVTVGKQFDSYRKRSAMFKECFPLTNADEAAAYLRNHYARRIQDWNRLPSKRRCTVSDVTQSAPGRGYKRAREECNLDGAMGDVTVGGTCMESIMHKRAREECNSEGAVMGESADVGTSGESVDVVSGGLTCMDNMNMIISDATESNTLPKISHAKRQLYRRNERKKRDMLRRYRDMGTEALNIANVVDSRTDTRMNYRRRRSVYTKAAKGQRKYGISIPRFLSDERAKQAVDELQGRLVNTTQVERRIIVETSGFAKMIDGVSFKPRDTLTITNIPIDAHDIIKNHIQRVLSAAQCSFKALMLQPMKDSTDRLVADVGFDSQDVMNKAVQTLKHDCQAAGAADLDDRDDSISSSDETTREWRIWPGKSNRLVKAEQTNMDSLISDLLHSKEADKTKLINHTSSLYHVGLVIWADGCSNQTAIMVRILDEHGTLFRTHSSVEKRLLKYIGGEHELAFYMPMVVDALVALKDKTYQLLPRREQPQVQVVPAVCVCDHKALWKISGVPGSGSDYRDVFAFSCPDLWTEVAYQGVSDFSVQRHWYVPFRFAFLRMCSFESHPCFLIVFASIEFNDMQWQN